MVKFPENTKIGLEVHLQVNAGKLFCGCEGEGMDRERSFQRTLHSSSGETGSSDISTMYEESRNRTFKYIVSTNSCLVEADEEPPHKINEMALNASLMMARAFNSEILDRVVVMRKVVIDGSNTGGFQRTSLIAMGGEIKGDTYSSKISAICLEEDACRKIEERGNEVVYSLDRLGVPLIEISTEPDIKNPEGAVEIAREIGNRLLSAGLLKKGADSIRQDVNFSMGYGRVEIKGVSKLTTIPDILEREMERQKSLAEAVGIWKERGGTENVIFEANNAILNGTGSRLILKSVENGKDILLSILKNGRGLLKNGNFRIGREIADALKQIGITGILHYDELPAYGITQEEKDRIANYLNLGEGDSFLILLEESAEKERAERVINDRISKIMSLNFSETRAAMDDFSTRYMRPLSGSSRMYPETDISVIEINESRLREIEGRVPLRLEEMVEKISREYSISKQDASTLIWNGMTEIFMRLSEKYDSRAICRELVQKLPDAERKKNVKIPAEYVEDTLNYCIEKNYGRYSMERAIDLLSEGKLPEEIKSEENLKPLDENEIIEALKNIKDTKNISLVAKQITEMKGRPVDTSIIARLVKVEKR